MTKGQFFLGTSGWIYSHWEKVFYPPEVSSRSRLKYYSKFFNTVEVNYSFYHLPRKTTYQLWYQQTPNEFVFSLKVSRFITHIKRLKGIKSSWEEFFRRAGGLKEKLGPFLFQFPPSFKADLSTRNYFEKFLEYLNKRYPHNRFAFEFRHRSWFNKDIYQILKENNVSLVVADSSRYPKADVITADFVYIRMHGPNTMFASNYSKKELRDLANKITDWQNQGLDIYCYFNNDFYGYAIKNAITLKQILRKI